MLTKSLLLTLSVVLLGVQGNTYDPNVAMRGWYYSKASFCGISSILQWNCDACVHIPHFQPLNAFSNDSWDMQAYTGYNPDFNEIVLSFRGSANIENWIADLDFTMIDYPPCSSVGGCQVHQGFYSVWKLVGKNILWDYQTLQKKYPNATVFVTGHSLGAAVSMHAALGVLQSFPTAPVVIYNYGEPRVGDPKFAQYASSVLPSGKQFRLTHARDPVPHLPPIAFGFLHTPNEVFYNNDGNTSWVVCKDTPTQEDESCSDGQLDIDPNDHLLYLGVHSGC